jgi:hypothetical protein
MDKEQGMTQMITLSLEHEKLGKELHALKERAASFKGKLSEEGNIPLFLKVIASETSALNIKVVSLVPQEEKLDPLVHQYKSYLIELKLISGFNPFILFLDRLKELPILTVVERFEIEKGEMGTRDVKIDLKLRTCFSQG